MIAHHTNNNASKPPLDRRRAVVLGESSMQDEKRVLHNVFSRRFRNTEATCCSPHEGEVFFVSRFKRQHL